MFVCLQLYLLFIVVIVYFIRYATIKQIQEFIVGIFKLKSEEVRLWEMGDDETPILLEEEEKSLEELGYTDKQRILIEIRNKDNSWPEEVNKQINKQTYLLPHL